MKKFEIGKKYAIYSPKGIDCHVVGTLEVLKRTAKFVTCHDDFFDRTKKYKVVEKDGTESIFAFYSGVYASDLL